MKRLIIPHYILTAVSAAALLFASCTRVSEKPGEAFVEEGLYDIVLTASIADNNPATRGVTVSPEAITSTWSTDDQVALVYNGEVISQLTVSSISGNSAQLTGKVWGAYPTGTKMSLYYGGTDYDYSGQNGTKASAEARAYLKADITTVTQAGKILTLSAVELKHQQAYFELSFRNGPDQLKIQSVEVTGTDHIIKTRTIGANGGTAYYSNTSDGEHFTITAEGSEGLSTVYFVISDDGVYTTAPTYSFKVTAVGISEPFTKEYKLDSDNNVVNLDLNKSLKIENGTYHSGEWILHQQTLSYTAPVAQSAVYDGQSHELVTPGTVSYNNGEAEGAVMEYYVHAGELGTVVDTTAFSPYTLPDVTWSTEVPAAIEPGDYYVWFRIKGGVNFEDVAPHPATDMPAVIDKRTLDVTVPVGVANLTYTGSAQALVTPGSLKDQLSEEFNPGLEIQYFSAYVTPDSTTDPEWPEATANGWSTEIPYGLHAGKYYVWYKVDGGAHYKDVGPYRVVFPLPSTLTYIPIAQSDAVIANAVPIEGLVYNGADQQLVLPADASDGCEVTYFVTENATLVPAADATGWTTEIAKAKNAGTYYTWVKVVDKTGGDNVSYTGFTDTGVSAAAVVTTIAKAPITVTVPAQIANWTYDGEEHTLLAASPVTAVTYKDKDNQDASAIASTENPNAAELYYIVNGVATKYTPETPNLPKAANAGSYAISYRVDGGRNFESKSATSLGTVTVSKATLTATADNKSREYGVANPELTVTVTGFVNSETAATASGYVAPTASTTAISTSNVGNYPITVSGGSADNYTFSYVAGTLTIEKANQSAPTLPSVIILTGGAISHAGITTDMEYSTDGGSTWTAVETAGTITGLSAGTLRVRYKADANHNPGTAKVIEVTEVVTPPEGAIDGLFSVSATQKVYFSKGNLQATGTATSTPASGWTWAFAEHQYDIIGSAAANNVIDGNGSVSAAGTVDLFGWSTAGTYYGINNSTSDGDYSGSFVDWGNTMGSGWRTLTSDEWSYLLTNHTKGQSTVNGVSGYVVRPDGVTTSINSTYTAEEWATQEAAGSIFLPAGGQRQGTNVMHVVDYYGYYWSSSINSSINGDNPVHLLLGYGDPQINSSNRLYGYSVRLVINLPQQGSAGVSNYNVNNPQNW